MSKSNLYAAVGGAYTLFAAALDSLIREEIVRETKQGKSKLIFFPVDDKSTVESTSTKEEAVDFMSPRTVRASTKVLHSIVSDYSLNDKQKTDMLSHYNQIILDNGINETKATGR